MRSTATKKPKRVVNLRLSTDTIERAKEIARASGSTESEVYRSALITGLDQIEQWMTEQSLAESILAHGMRRA